MNIFFINVGRRCELVEAFARVLPAVSPGLIWGSDPNPLAPGLAVVDRQIDLPAKIDSEEFLQQLCIFLAREEIDLVIPTIDPDLLRLDLWRDTLKERAPHAQLLLSPSSVIHIAKDKRRSRDEFARLGATVPEAVDPNDANLQFPLFIKPASGSASVGAARVDSPEDLRSRLATTRAPMVERLVTGEEITVDVLMDLDGRPVYAVPRRRLDVRGGEVSRGVVERCSELEQLAFSLAEGLGATGPVTIQFRNPKPFCWVAMEINARMGGGLPLSIKAGADWPRWILEMATGNRPSIEPAVVHDRLVMSRADKSIFLPPAGINAPAGLVEPLSSVIVFDMDDTLYPEADFVQSGHRAVAERVWQDLQVDIEPELRRRFLAGQRGDLMSAALKDLGVKIRADYVTTELVPAYRNHKPNIQPYVETVPVLSELARRGHRLALLSDGWAFTQRRKLESLGIADFFEKIVFTDELGRDAWKPAARGFSYLLDAMGVQAKDAVYVADNPQKDFMGPKQLGMSTIRVVRSGTEHGGALASTLRHEAHRQIQSLSELLEAPGRAKVGDDAFGGFDKTTGTNARKSRIVRLHGGAF